MAVLVFKNKTFIDPDICYLKNLKFIYMALLCTITKTISRPAGALWDLSMNLIG